MHAEGTPPHHVRAQDLPGSFEVLVVAALPQRLVDDAGASAQLWYHIIRRAPWATSGGLESPACKLREPPLVTCVQDSPDSFEVLVVAALPQRLVDDAGAPAQLWYHITSPASSDALLFDVLWVNKTPSRLPEVRSGNPQVLAQCREFCAASSAY